MIYEDEDGDDLIVNELEDVGWELSVTKLQLADAIKERDQAQRRTDAFVRIMRAVADLMANVADTVVES
jgi:hypothetical protein